jgi:UDPglucose 6-dehydrogenase
MADANGQVSAVDLQLIQGNVTVAKDSYHAAQAAHAIAVLTEWDEFKQLDYQQIYQAMQQPAFVFDGRNILDRRLLSQIGFEVHAIGKSY